MERKEIFDKVKNIIKEEFDDDSLDISEKTVAADVEEWDSLAQLSIIHEVEKTFKIRFSINEIKGFRNVGEMLDCISERMKKA